MANFYEFRHAALEGMVSREKNRQRSKEVLARVAVSILNGVQGVSGLRPGVLGNMCLVDGMSSNDTPKASRDLTRYSLSGRRLRFAIRLIVVGEQDDDGKKEEAPEYRCDFPISVSFTSDDQKFDVGFPSESIEFFEGGDNTDQCARIWEVLQNQFSVANG